MREASPSFWQISCECQAFASDRPTLQDPKEPNGMAPEVIHIPGEDHLVHFALGPTGRSAQCASWWGTVVRFGERLDDLRPSGFMPRPVGE